jgi:hypothetical protein
MDKVAIHEGNAVAYLCDLGVSRLEARRVLSDCPIASSFGGADYYYPKDLHKAADSYLADA